jgi:hypothetical protein
MSACNRAGGVAEFPNLTANFVTSADSPTRKIVIELAAAPNERAGVKRFEESFTGGVTSVLVSPRLAVEKDSLGSASQMTRCRLVWALEASGGTTRVSPRQLIAQTGFWVPHLVHEQHGVDMLTEDDVAAGRLRDYEALCVVEPHISARATAAIEHWVGKRRIRVRLVWRGQPRRVQQTGPGLARVFGNGPAIRGEAAVASTASAAASTGWVTPIRSRWSGPCSSVSRSRLACWA